MRFLGGSGRGRTSSPGNFFAGFQQDIPTKNIPTKSLGGFGRFLGGRLGGAGFCKASARVCNEESNYYEIGLLLVRMKSDWICWCYCCVGV